MASLKDILAKVERLFAEWQSLQPISKENADRLWKKFRLEWNYNSNHIEGNTLTYGETQLLLFFDKTTGDHEMREFEEMKAHDVAVAAVRQWATQEGRDITEADIRELNQLILVRPFWKEALTYDGQPTRRQIKVGEYKEHPNSVRLANGEMFHYASPEEVPIKMHELMEWYRDNQDLSPAILAAEMHYRFILIHPFDDGNGRIARLLMNYIFIKNGLPPIIIKSADKKNYLTALNKADTGNKEAFHEYIAEQLVWSLEIAVKAAKGDEIEEDDDLDKEIQLLSREAAASKIIEKKSREVIQELYFNSLKDFYEKLERTLKKFDQLFVEVETDYFIDNENDSCSFSESLGLEYFEKQLMYDFHKEYEAIRIGEALFSDMKDEIHRMEMKFVWKGYKNARTDFFNITCWVITSFENYKYKVAMFLGENEAGVGLVSLEKAYAEKLSGDESEVLLKEISRHVLNNIKKRAENGANMDA